MSQSTLSAGGREGGEKGLALCLDVAAALVFRLFINNIEAISLLGKLFHLFYRLDILLSPPSIIGLPGWHSMTDEIDLNTTGQPGQQTFQRAN